MRCQGQGSPPGLQAWQARSPLPCVEATRAGVLGCIEEACQGVPARCWGNLGRGVSGLHHEPELGSGWVGMIGSQARSEPAQHKCELRMQQESSMLAAPAQS